MVFLCPISDAGVSLSTFTRAEILEVIAELKAAIRAVTLGQTYSIDTGQGRQSVTRASLSGLEKSLGFWEMRLADTDGDSGVSSLEVVR